MTNPTPHGQVPEALRLAHIFDNPLPPEWPDMVAAAAELRRQHARIAELEAVGAGGVQALSAEPAVDITTAGEMQAFEAWYKQDCVIEGASAKMAAKAAWKARAALAKWGSPQPVVREPLTNAQIAEMMRDTWGCASIAPRHALEFARAIERAHGITGGQHGTDTRSN